MSARRTPLRRFTVGSATGARSQAWAVGPRRRRDVTAARATVTPTESTVFVGPADRAREAMPAVPAAAGAWGVAVPEPVGPDPLGIGAPERLPDRHLGGGWQVGAVIVIAPFAADTAAAAGDPAPARHYPLPWPGRVVHAIVALAGPSAPPLGLAAHQDGGRLVQPGVGQVQLWITYVTHQPLPQRRAADPGRYDPGTAPAPSPGFARTVACRDYPVLLDLGHWRPSIPAPAVASAASAAS